MLESTSIFWPLLLVAIVWVWRTFSRPSPPPAAPLSTTSFPELKEVKKEQMVNAYVKNEGGYKWGRYEQPIRNPNIMVRSALGNTLKEFRLKHWHLISVTTPTHIVTLAVVHVGYVANAWCYVFSPSNKPELIKEVRMMLPLAKGVAMADSSCEKGKSSFKTGNNLIEMSTEEDKYKAKVDLSSKGITIKGEFEVEKPSKSLVLLYPLEHGVLPFPRAAYTHKAAGMKASGSIKCGDEVISLEGGLACMDWTKSFARRETRWKWVSFASTIKDEQGVSRDVGVNLSAEVYEDTENVVFVDGNLYPKGGITVDNSNPKEIHIRTADESVVLTFKSMATKFESVNAVMIKDKFAQHCGTYSGTIKVTSGEKEIVLNIRECLGVYEEHYALW